MKIEITHKLTGSVLFEAECGSLKWLRNWQPKVMPI